jgi:diacylglycerol kinase (ATP)
MRTKRSGALRAFYAMRHTCAGLVATWQNESAFRQESVAALILLPCAIALPVGPVARVLLVASVLLVLLVELLNSAIEAAIDRISLDHHELSRRAKDCGSAAVGIALLMCVFTWAMLAGPIVIRWLHVL